jgi:uncharacterized protein with HEPN domain
MARAAADHLVDILEAIKAIEDYTKPGREAFERDPMMRDAVAARLMQIGQAVKDAQAEGLELSQLQPTVPWRNIAGMRDRLVHKYRLMDIAIVWGVVDDELPKVRSAVEALLKSQARRGR